MMLDLFYPENGISFKDIQHYLEGIPIDYEKLQKHFNLRDNSWQIRHIDLMLFKHIEFYLIENYKLDADTFGMMACQILISKSIEQAFRREAAKKKYLLFGQNIQNTYIQILHSKKSIRMFALANPIRTKMNHTNNNKTSLLIFCLAHCLVYENSVGENDTYAENVD